MKRMVSFTFILLILSFCDVANSAQTTIFSISSVAETRYFNQNFDCVPGADCQFSCNSLGFTGSGGLTQHACTMDNSYYSNGGCACSTITCSDGFNCDISCNKQNSCQSNTFSCGNDSTCNIFCTESDSCASGTLNCGTGSTCSIHCRGYGSCSGLNINVEEDAVLNLYCNGGHSCFHGNVNCGENSNCSVYCEAYGQYGDSNSNFGFECAEMEINAANSNSLSIDVYNDEYAAQNMVVYAPNNDASSPTIIKCGISDHSAASGKYSCDEMKIYSVEGWNDVELQLNWVTAANVFVDYTSENQKMFCGPGYNFFCYGWMEDTVDIDMQCHDDIVICNNPTLITVITNSPSVATQTTSLGASTTDQLTISPTSAPTDAADNAEHDHDHNFILSCIVLLSIHFIFA
eukprot:511820_1